MSNLYSTRVASGNEYECLSFRISRPVQHLAPAFPGARGRDHEHDRSREARDEAGLRRARHVRADIPSRREHFAPALETRAHAGERERGGFGERAAGQRFELELHESFAAI